MDKIQEKFAFEAYAIKKAEELSKKYPYVCIIKDHRENRYYVETEPNMIRNFEEIIKEYEENI